MASFSTATNRCNVTLTGSEITRNNTGAGNLDRTLNIHLTLTQPTTITSAGLTTDNFLDINGTILGVQPVTKAGNAMLQLQLTGYGRDSRVSSVTIDEGTVFVSDTAAAVSIIQGIGGAGGEPSACPITLNGNNTTLRYGASTSPNVEWGNPLIVTAGVTNARLLFQNSGNND
jgi:hypothetical protein